MSVDKGFIKYPVYRGDDEPYILKMFDGDNDDIPLNVSATYDEIILEARKGNNENAPLVFRKTLSGGTITITNTNEINYNLSTSEKAGVYYLDLRFRISGTEKWKTIIKGIMPVEDNISKL